MSTMMMSREKARQVRPPAVKPQAERRAIAVAVENGPDWKSWLEDLAAQRRTEVAKAIDDALVECAKMKGHDREAPRR
jgi:hypothetical protein